VRQHDYRKHNNSGELTKTLFEIEKSHTYGGITATTTQTGLPGHLAGSG